VATEIEIFLLAIIEINSTFDPFEMKNIQISSNDVSFQFQSPITLCNLGVGATFGESVLHDLPRDSTVVTKTTCELLRVEQQDFRLIWEVSESIRFSIRFAIQCGIMSRFALAQQGKTLFQSFKLFISITHNEHTNCIR
jgi:CRP-like cAMP-binding protein